MPEARGRRAPDRRGAPPGDDPGQIRRHRPRPRNTRSPPRTPAGRSWRRRRGSCSAPLASPVSARPTGRTTRTSGSASPSPAASPEWLGMVVWGKYLMPRGPFSEARHRACPDPGGARGVHRGFCEPRKVAVERRAFLVKALGLAFGILGVVLAFPLIRSLGPLPGKTLYETIGARAPTSSTSPAARSRPTTSRSGGSSPSSRRTTSGAPIPRRCSSTCSRCERVHDAAAGFASSGPPGRRRATSPSRSSAPTPVARSGSTRSSPSRCSAPATSRCSS